MLFKTNEESLEIEVAGYEFPEGVGEDADWLVLKGTYKADGTVTKDRVVPPGDAREDQAWWAPDKLPHAIDFVDGLKDICEEYHCTQTDLAIAFIRHGRPYVIVIYGARKIKHLEAGAATVNVTLRDDTVAEIRRRAEELEAKYGG